jgi:mono/diheme cytochrome c family protein
LGEKRYKWEKIFDSRRFRFMKGIVSWVVVGFFLGMTLLWAEDSAAGEYEKGAKLYDGKCVICHGKDGKGNGPGAAAFSPKPADFTAPEFWQKMDDEKIANTIKNGHGMMPPFDLTSDQDKAIIDYLRHAFKK